MKKTKEGIHLEGMALNQCSGAAEHRLSGGVASTV